MMPERIAARQRVMDLSLSGWLSRLQPGAAAGKLLLNKTVISNHGDALDALTTRYGTELGEVEGFNESAAISKVAAAGALVDGRWSRDDAARELQAALAAEP